MTRWILLALLTALLAGAPTALAGQGAGQEGDKRATSETAETSSEPPEGPPGSARYGGDRPAEGEPYQWRQMALAGVIILITLALLIWLIRRQKRS